MSAADLPLVPARRTLDPTVRGVIAMVAGMGFQVANDAVLKIASVRLPVHEIMALRGLPAIALTLAVIAVAGHGRKIGSVAQPLVALRSGLEAACCLIYVTALSGLGLAEFTSIVQATPLIITALAVLLGWQSVGWRRWAAIFVGFVGVLLVAKPSAHGINGFAALALLSAFFMAVRDLVTRKIPASAPSLVVTLGSTVAVMLLGFAMGAAHPGSWVMPNGYEIALLASAACLVCACNMLIILAFRTGDMTVVGPFRYSVIIGSLAVGYAVFGDRPDALALVGAALIVGSGLYALKRDARRGGAVGKTAPV